jgi:hypothetical protein
LNQCDGLLVVGTSGWKTGWTFGSHNYFPVFLFGHLGPL